MESANGATMSFKGGDKLTCRVDAKFVPLQLQEEDLSKELQSALDKIYNDGNKLHWKPDQVHLNGTTTGYILWIRRDC